MPLCLFDRVWNEMLTAQSVRSDALRSSRPSWLDGIVPRIWCLRNTHVCNIDSRIPDGG